MRIIAGTLRRRPLLTPTWTGLRPTSDRLRETIFNVIGSRVADADVLDLFAGTGAMAIEAMSRGARHAVCIDSDRRAVALVRANVERCGLQERVAVVQSRAECWTSQGKTWDIIYADPPYEWRDLEPLLRHMALLSAPNAWTMIEHAAKTVPPDASGVLVRRRTVRAGDSAVSIYAREGAEATPMGEGS